MRLVLLLALLVGCAVRPCDDDDSADIDCDADGDGYWSTVTACGGDDCDDSDPAVHPWAEEIADGEGVDHDCDGDAL